MMTRRPAAERGHGQHGWLDTRHTFSFGDYFDPRQVGFRSLRVVNEDRVAPGQGFGTHGHRDMEIITYVLEGALSHRDSLGHGATLRPGELQHMTAGSGIRHSEFNPSEADPVHFYQVWIIPEGQGLPPSYNQKAFPPEDRRNRFCVVATPDGRDGSLAIRQDAAIHLATLDAGAEVAHPFAPGRHGWLQVLRGTVRVGSLDLLAGDGLALSDEPEVTVVGSGEPGAPAEVMLFDLG